MRGRQPFPIFMVAASLYFASVGLQGVIFSALVVFELKADPIWVGTAQSALMLPSVFFVLIGGHVADRVDRRRLLGTLSLLAGIAALGLLALVAGDRLSLGAVIGYALLAGTIQAFIMPARDAMLSDVSGENLGRAVAGLLMAQWGSQAAGALLGASARFIGIEAAIAMQAALILISIPLILRLPSSLPAAAPVSEPLHRALLGGLFEVWRSPVLRIPFLLAVAVGIFTIGPYIVVLPVLVRNYYGGGVGELGLLGTAFPLGTIVGSSIVLRRGIRRKGRAQALALCSSSSAILVISSGIPFPGALACVFFWGISGAIFMNAGRSLFQEKASPTHRGRVLSVYTLGFMGASGLIGAPLAGALLDEIGIHATLAGTASATLLTLLLIFLWGGFTTVDGESGESGPHGLNPAP